MMKTVLSIVQSFCRRANLPVPTALAASTDPAELQLLELVYEVCEELRAAKVWTCQKRKHEFDTVADTSQYMLPADFYSPLPSTFWNQDEDIELVGPAMDSTFNFFLHSGSSPTVNYVYRPFGWDQNRTSTLGQFEVSPTPSSAQTLSFDYVTRHMFLPADYALATAYSADALVNVNGEIYKCGAGGITATDTVPSGKTTGIADDDGTWDWYNTPVEAIAADTDLCLFDYDLVILGLKARWYEEKGGVWENARTDFDNRIEDAVNRYKGSYVGTLDGPSYGPAYRVPRGNWNI